MKGTLLRRIRGALGNALVWGGVWFSATAVLNIVTSFAFGRTPSALMFLSLLYGSAIVGTVGAVTGGMFSAFIAANFRRSRIDELGAARVAFGGGLVATLVALVLMVTLSVLDGMWPILTLADIAFPVLLSAALGSITGFSSIKLAQRPLPAAAETPELPTGAG